MRLLSKASILSSVFLCALVASASSTARADLPFSFVIKGQSFSPGSYDIVMDPTHSFITLSNQTRFAERIVFSLGPADEAAAPATLTFDMCDGRAFLRDIHMGTSITGDLDRRGKRGNEACINVSGSTVTSKATDGTQMAAGR